VAGKSSWETSFDGHAPPLRARHLHPEHRARDRLPGGGAGPAPGGSILDAGCGNGSGAEPR